MAICPGGVVTPLLGIAAHAAQLLERPRVAPCPLAASEVSAARPEPLQLPDSALELIEWNVVKGWAADDHATAFTTFLTSSRPLVRSSLGHNNKRPMYVALAHVCRQALAAGRLTEDRARLF